MFQLVQYARVRPIHSPIISESRLPSFPSFPFRSFRPFAPLVDTLPPLFHSATSHDRQFNRARQQRSERPSRGFDLDASLDLIACQDRTSSTRKTECRGGLWCESFS